MFSFKKNKARKRCRKIWYNYQYFQKEKMIPRTGIGNHGFWKNALVEKTDNNEALVKQDVMQHTASVVMLVADFNGAFWEIRRSRPKYSEIVALLHDIEEAIKKKDNPDDGGSSEEELRAKREREMKTFCKRISSYPRAMRRLLIKGFARFQDGAGVYPEDKLDWISYCALQTKLGNPGSMEYKRVNVPPRKGSKYEDGLTGQDREAMQYTSSDRPLDIMVYHFMTHCDEVRYSCRAIYQIYIEMLYESIDGELPTWYGRLLKKEFGTIPKWSLLYGS